MRAMILILIVLLPLTALGENRGMRPSIQEVKKQHAARFLDLAGVVSVGIGRDSNGDQAIIVGLDRPHPETEAKIPARLEGYPVVVRIVGAVKAQ
jgi:microsomal dipeptidase-like Zn-dependent dipeptidase